MLRAALNRSAVDGNVAAQRSDICLLFGGQAVNLWSVQTPAKRAI